MMLLAPVTNWESHGVTLAEYCYAMRQRIKVQILTLYRVSQLQRYGVTVRGSVTSAYPRLRAARPLPFVPASPFPFSRWNFCYLQSAYSKD
jgi:hypothetical protein